MVTRFTEEDDALHKICSRNLKFCNLIYAFLKSLFNFIHLNMYMQVHESMGLSPEQDTMKKPQESTRKEKEVKIRQKPKKRR